MNGLGKNVFANGLEVSAKASSNRSIAAMPDVCLSPPGPPAGPVPIPYPNSAFARHTTGGSRTVKIGGQEVGKKNISKYAKSTGNEPATRTFGMGVVTHNITGPMKFAAWSMDVKVEGANVTRFMDLTTHNHANCGNGPITASMGGKGHGFTQENCETLAGNNQATRDEMAKKVAKDQASLAKRRRRPKKKPKTKKLESAAEAKARAEKAEEAEVTALNQCTITHSIHTHGGKTTHMKACSNAALAKYDNGFVTGLGTADSLAELDDERKKWIDMKAQKSSTGKSTVSYHNSLACFGTEGDAAPYKYKSAAQCSPGYPSHTEARIIDEIYKSASGHGGALLFCIDWPNGSKHEGEGLSKRSPCTQSCNELLCAAAACLTILLCDENDNPKPPKCPPKRPPDGTAGGAKRKAPGQDPDPEKPPASQGPGKKHKT